MSLTSLLVDNSPSYDLRMLFFSALLLLFVYLIANAIYQLYFSPLSVFPGPKLAAITLWYEIYYDVFKWGRYYIEIQKMHQKYGPIIRINPFELHVSDPNFIDALYSRSAPRNKHSYFTRQFGNDLTTFSTEDHYHHRLRRAALNTFFSRQRVLRLEGLIWSHVEKLCSRFEEHKSSGRPLPTGPAYGCLTADVIIEYSMGHKQKALEDKDFAPLFTQAVKKFASVGMVAKHMPFLHAILRAIPQHWIARVSPQYGAMLAFREMNNQRIREVFERKKKGISDGAGCGILGQNTIFQELVNSDLSPGEKSYDRLSQEGQLVVGAALDTTAHAMDTTTFHILNNPEKLLRLNEELRAAIPDPQAHIPLIELEQLPYLSAVIMEGLRLSIGVSNRNARIAHEPMLYKSHVIPAGVPVSMSVPLTHHDESVYPDSYSFFPERWLNGKTSDGQPLEKFFMTFGRGTRQCAGMTLAKAEMYIALAALLRRYDLELWESSRRDVNMVYDLFLPQADRASTGARVLVK